MNLIRQPRARLIVLTVMLGFFAVTLIPRCYTIWKLNGQKQALELKKVEYSQVNQQLVEQKDKLNSPLAVEKIAREKLGMVKKGEKVLMEVKTDGP